MKIISAILLILFSCVLNAADSMPIETYFRSLDHAEKHLFLKAMPKGGELHSHLGGSVYAEKLIELASNYCMQEKSHTLYKSKVCAEVQIKNLKKDPTLYNQTVQAWSMKNFSPNKESGHDHFFNTFMKFDALTMRNQPELIADTLTRAISQNESYIELMISPDLNQARQYSYLVDFKKPINKVYDALLEDKTFQHHISNTTKRIDIVDKKARKRIHCTQENCPISYGYQYYILRDQSMPQMIAQAVAAFETTKRSSKIVAINLVQAEDAYRSRKHYDEQMRVIGFLHKKYPSVNISLHAGELNKQIVAANDLRFHIHDAIQNGHAQRIGHGVDINFEDYASETMALMLKKDIPVEINLTSNEDILNASPRTHPLHLYLKHHVPVVLSTDDEGILRTTLTDEYLKAVEDYGITYPTLKQISRNSISYGFLPGNSMWLRNNRSIPVDACHNALKHMRLDKPCKHYLHNNAKAHLQWNLEKKLQTFEQNALNNTNNRPSK